MSEPSETVSPVLTFSSSTTPPNGSGTSMVALSDSSVTSGSSWATVSPGPTITSMIGTSVKSPMSGTTTSLSSAIVAASDRPGRRDVGVDVVALDRLPDGGALDLALVGQRAQRRDRDVVAVDLEEAPQLHAVLAAAEAVGAEHLVAAPAHERADLLGERADVVGRGHRRALAAGQGLRDEGRPRLLGRVQAAPALGRHAVAVQLGERGDAPYVGRDAEVVAQEVGAGQHLAQDRPGAHELHARAVGVAGVAQQVHALEDALLRE